MTTADATDFAGMFQLLARLPEAVQQRMVGMYLDALSTQVALLREVLEDEEWSRAEAVAHKLAGSAGMMQDARLSLAGRALENLLREDRFEEGAAAWPAVAERAAITREALRQAYPDWT